jgi:predicted ATPase with chaperone activity
MTENRGTTAVSGIAVAVLAAARQTPVDGLARTVLVAELGLNGAVRVPAGVRVRVAAAAAAGFRHVVLPTAEPFVDGITAWLLVTEVLGQFLVQSCFQNILGEQLQQPVRAGQLQATLPGLGHHRGRRGLLRRQPSALGAGLLTWTHDL